MAGDFLVGGRAAVNDEACIINEKDIKDDSLIASTDYDIFVFFVRATGLVERSVSRMTTIIFQADLVFYSVILVQDYCYKKSLVKTTCRVDICCNGVDSDCILNIYFRNKHDHSVGRHVVSINSIPVD